MWFCPSTTPRNRPPAVWEGCGDYLVLTLPGTGSLPVLEGVMVFEGLRLALRDRTGERGKRRV